MYSRASKNSTGLKLEYNVNCPDDVKLAAALVADWKRKGVTRHKLIAVNESKAA
ncbi:hypothetical protein [Endozoicomonas sp.]|uniref:hypothetical protein n=1 Tax=Endozoicomonas sp. TaxID=1892382 RepID=UPI00383ACECB